MLVLVLFGLDHDRIWRRRSGTFAAVYLLSRVVDLTTEWFWSSGWQPGSLLDAVTTAFISLMPACVVVLLVIGLRRRRDVALLPIVVASTALESYIFIADGLGQLVQWTGITIGAIYSFGAIQIGPYSLNLESQLQLVLLVALVWTVFREQARERKRQLFVESEMKSAQEIQQVLVPEDTPAVPGFAVSSLYWPAGEVGGDMFQVIPGKDGDLTLMIADVSGKGLKAAMTVSLMVGAARTLVETTTQPGAVLAGLNRRLMGRTNGGFATCLVLHVTAAGDVAIANAGHLAPFLNGQEMEIEGSLPLGISYDAEFSESRISLCESDELTLYTDGVLEAQNKSGELYGFHRCAELMRSSLSVQAIAEAAKAFGQNDDITVVKIVRVHAEDARERMSVHLTTVAVA